MQEQASGFCLSLQQKRLLSLGNDGTTNRARCAILLEGEVDEATLREALRKVVQRHEVLCTDFRHVPGIKLPLQFIDETGTVAWHTLELPGANPQEQEAEIERLFRLAAEHRHESAGEVSATLLTLSGGRRVLYVSTSPLCADAATLMNLARELAREYEAGVKGEELQGQPIQYLIFSEWQNNLLEKEESEAGKAYWRKQDPSGLPPLTLPGESKTQADGVFDPSSYSFVLDALARMDALAEKHQTTIDSFLLACWQTLLWRLTAQPDIVVAVTLDGRKFEALEEVHGPFAKALRIKISFDNSPFVEALARVDRAVREAYDWQEYFAWEHGPETHAGDERASFFPVGFESLKCPPSFDAAGVRFSIYRYYSCIDKFKIKLLCVRSNEALRVELQYDPACYESEAVERLAGQVETLLMGASSKPETHVSRLPLLTERERQQLLYDWNATRELPRASLPSPTLLRTGRSHTRFHRPLRFCSRNHLPSTRPSLESTRAPAARARRRPGLAGRPSHEPLRRDGRLAAGGAQGRRGLPPTRSAIPGGTTRFHAQGRRCANAAHAAGTARRVGRTIVSSTTRYPGD
jgi:hypothetical protein